LAYCCRHFGPQGPSVLSVLSSLAAQPDPLVLLFRLIPWDLDCLGFPVGQYFQLLPVGLEVLLDRLVRWILECLVVRSSQRYLSDQDYPGFLAARYFL
jgi:hypothetical protein